MSTRCAAMCVATASSHRQAASRRADAPDMPAILLEIGYLSNGADERLLLQKAHQQRLARAIADAADRYFGTRPASPRWCSRAPAVKKGVVPAFNDGGARNHRCAPSSSA